MPEMNGLEKDHNLTEEENKQFLMARNCYACNCVLDKYNPGVRDHCHITGNYRGAGMYENILIYFLCFIHT